MDESASVYASLGAVKNKTLRVRQMREHIRAGVMPPSHAVLQSQMEGVPTTPRKLVLHEWYEADREAIDMRAAHVMLMKVSGDSEGAYARLMKDIIKRGLLHVSFEDHICFVQPLSERGGVLDVAYRYGELVADFDIHIAPLGGHAKCALMAAWRFGDLEPEDRHLDLLSIPVSEDAVAVAFDRGLRPADDLVRDAVRGGWLRVLHAASVAGAVLTEEDVMTAFSACRARTKKFGMNPSKLFVALLGMLYKKGMVPREVHFKNVDCKDAPRLMVAAIPAPEFDYSLSVHYRWPPEGARAASAASVIRKTKKSASIKVCCHLITWPTVVSSCSLGTCNECMVCRRS